MNFKNILTAAAVIYDEMATGGAKEEADKILALILDIVGGQPASPIAPAVTEAAH